MVRKNGKPVTNAVAATASTGKVGKKLDKVLVPDAKVFESADGNDYLMLASGRLEMSLPAPVNPAPPSETRKGHLFFTTHGVKDFKGADGLANGHYIAINWCYDPNRIGRDVA